MQHLLLLIKTKFQRATGRGAGAWIKMKGVSRRLKKPISEIIPGPVTFVSMFFRSLIPGSPGLVLFSHAQIF